MREDSELVVSFHSSVLEKLRAVKCPDIQCLNDSNQEKPSVPVSPDMNQSDTEFSENIPTINSGLPQVKWMMALSLVIDRNSFRSNIR